MGLAEITFALFTCCNSARVLAYLPQVLKAAADREGAKAVSLATWGLFLVSHLSAAAYAFVNKGDATLALVFLGNAMGSGAIFIVATVKRLQHTHGSLSAMLDNAGCLLRRQVLTLAG
jgi:hypothetical protein